MEILPEIAVHYTPLNEGIIDDLRAIAGDRHVVTDPDILETYGRDETKGLFARPEAVVRVATTGETSRVLHLANRHHFAVTPRGAGTGLSGGAIPVAGGVVLSLERMNRILSIDTDNMLVTVQPGVITKTLQDAVEAEGLFYPPDPASIETCSIGGNVAEDAGGARCLKYGTTRDYVLGLEVVLPTGEVIRAGGHVVKDVTGYDLVGLVTRSEGTLGVITEITLRLIPRPLHTVDLLVPFANFDDAPRCVSEVLRRRIIPTAIEFMDDASIRMVEEHLEKEFPHHDAPAHLIFEIDGDREEALSDEMAAIGEVCGEFGGMEVFAALDPPEKERLWEARRAIAEAANARAALNETLDIVVPRMKIPDAVRLVREKAAMHRLPACTFGHLGDGNVHAILMQGDYPEEAWWHALRGASRDIYAGTVALGGKITAEHGIGLTRKEYLTLDVSPAELRLLRAIKDAFDPNGILNPGKIFPDK